MRVLAAIGAAVLAIAGAAAWVATRGSPGDVQVPRIPPAARVASPPAPPRGALVLARGHGDLAVAIAARRSAHQVRITVTVIAPDGDPPRRPCGARRTGRHEPAPGEGLRRGLLRVGRCAECVRTARGGPRERSGAPGLDGEFGLAGALARLGGTVAAGRRAGVSELAASCTGSGSRADGLRPRARGAPSRRIG